MPRQARQKSALKVYHAILRGVNKQQIFECTEDYEHFVRILQRQCGLPVETRPSKVAKHRSYQEVVDEGLESPPMIEDRVPGAIYPAFHLDFTQYSGATNATEFQALPRPMQKHYLYMVHELTNEA